MPTLVERAQPFGLVLTPEQLDAFDVYLTDLATWNARMNLTAIVEREQMVVKHLLDSLSLARVLRPAAGDSLIDVGTGAGLPGVPLKIVFPSLRLTLLEATHKKVDFLNHVIERLALTDTRAIAARAEDLGQDPAHREQYDFAVARAVAALPTLAEYALPFVRGGGVFVAQKGVAVDDEVNQSTRALELLGGRLREVAPVQVPGLEVRHLIVIDKVAPTPAAYPRRAGVPERKPIR